MVNERRNINSSPLLEVLYTSASGFNTFVKQVLQIGKYLTLINHPNIDKIQRKLNGVGLDTSDCNAQGAGLPRFEKLSPDRRSLDEGQVNQWETFSFKNATVGI